MVKYARKNKSSKKYTKKMVRKVSSNTALRKVVQQVLNKQAETRSFITAVTESTVNTLTSPTTSNEITLNSLAVSTLQGGRIGMKVTGKFCNVRGSIYNPTDLPIYVRLMLIYADESDAPSNDLLETNNATFGAPSVDLASIYARVNTTKYKVLAHKVIKVGNTAGLQNTQLFNMTLRLNNIAYHYENVSAQTTPKKRLMFIYWARRSDNDESLGSNLEITWNSKFYYQDI